MVDEHRVLIRINVALAVLILAVLGGFTGIGVYMTRRITPVVEEVREAIGQLEDACGIYTTLNVSDVTWEEEYGEAVAIGK